MFSADRCGRNPAAEAWVNAGPPLLFGPDVRSSPLVGDPMTGCQLELSNIDLHRCMAFFNIAMMAMNIRKFHAFSQVAGVVMDGCGFGDRRGGRFGRRFGCPRRPRAEAMRGLSWWGGLRVEALAARWHVWEGSLVGVGSPWVGRSTLTGVTPSCACPLLSTELDRN